MEPSALHLSCSTIGFNVLTLDGALAHIAELGFTEVEIGVLGDFCPHIDPLAAVDESIERCLEALGRSGLVPVALNSAPRIYCDDPQDLAQLLDVADRLLLLAGALHCELIVDASERAEGTEDERRRSADLVREVFRRGRDSHGVTVSVEAPHRGMSAETITEALQLLDMVGENDLGITYDTSHATCGGVSAADGLRLVGDRIARVQVRDHRGGDVHHTPGDGEYDWPALTKFLATNPLPVCIELEFDGRLPVPAVADEIVRGRRFLEQVAGGS